MATPFFDTVEPRLLWNKFVSSPTKTTMFVNNEIQRFVESFKSKLIDNKTVVAEEAKKILGGSWRGRAKFEDLVDRIADNFTHNEMKYYANALNGLESDFVAGKTYNESLMPYMKEVHKLSQWKLDDSLKAIKPALNPAPAQLPIGDDSEAQETQQQVEQATDTDKPEKKGPGIVRRTAKALALTVGAGLGATMAYSKSGRALLKAGLAFGTVKSAWSSVFARKDKSADTQSSGSAKASNTDFTPREEKVEAARDTQQTLDEQKKQTELLEQIEKNTRGDGTGTDKKENKKGFWASLFGGAAGAFGAAKAAAGAGIMGAGMMAARAIPLLGAAALAGFSVKEAWAAIEDGVLGNGTGENNISKAVDILGKTITGDEKWTLGKSIFEKVEKIEKAVGDMTDAMKAKIDEWTNKILDAMPDDVSNARKSEEYTAQARANEKKALDAGAFNIDVNKYKGEYANVRDTEGVKFLQKEKQARIEGGVWDPDKDPESKVIQSLLSTYEGNTQAVEYDPVAYQTAVSLKEKYGAAFDPIRIQGHGRIQAQINAHEGLSQEEREFRAELKVDEVKQQEAAKFAAIQKNEYEGAMKTREILMAEGKWDPVNKPEQMEIQRIITKYVNSADFQGKPKDSIRINIVGDRNDELAKGTRPTGSKNTTNIVNAPNTTNINNNNTHVLSPPMNPRNDDRTFDRVLQGSVSR